MTSPSSTGSTETLFETLCTVWREWIAGLTNEGRAELFERLFAGHCKHCFGKLNDAGVCYCMLDD